MASAQLLVLFFKVPNIPSLTGASAYFAPPPLRSGSAKQAQSQFDRTLSQFDRTPSHFDRAATGICRPSLRSTTLNNVDFPEIIDPVKPLHLLLFPAILLLHGASLFAADQAVPDPGKPDTAWFTDAGFGIFLHWGAYSQAGGRWKGLERTRDLWGEWLLNRANISGPDYEALARSFNPTQFRPWEWAEASRMPAPGYVVLTAKHHEGFAMYHSRASRFNSFDWPDKYHGDPVRELGDAVRQAGIKFGVYYSQKVDWHNCHSKNVTFEDYFYKICIPQVTELVKGYGSLAILWFDIGIGDKTEAGRLRACRPPIRAAGVDLPSHWRQPGRLFRGRG